MTKKHKAYNTNVIVRDINFTEQKSKGGIIIETANNYDMSRAEGVLEDIGPNAFDDFGNFKPKVGDRIVYARYAGKFLGTYADGDERRIMRDLDVLCLVEGAE